MNSPTRPKVRKPPEIVDLTGDDDDDILHVVDQPRAGSGANATSYVNRAVHPRPKETPAVAASPFRGGSKRSSSSNAQRSPSKLRPNIGSTPTDVRITDASEARAAKSGSLKMRMPSGSDAHKRSNGQGDRSNYKQALSAPSISRSKPTSTSGLKRSFDSDSPKIDAHISKKPKHEANTSEPGSSGKRAPSILWISPPPKGRNSPPPKGRPTKRQQEASVRIPPVEQLSSTGGHASGRSHVPEKPGSTSYLDKANSDNQTTALAQASTPATVKSPRRRSLTAKGREFALHGKPEHDDGETPSAAAAADEADLQLRREAMEGVESTVPDTTAPGVFAFPGVAASETRAAALATLPLSKQVESALGRHIQEMRDDTEYWNCACLPRARLEKETILLQQALPIVSFRSMPPMTFITTQKKKDTSRSQTVDKLAAGPPGYGTSAMAISTTTFKTDTRDVPDYSHYVSIPNNVVAPNVKNLHCWPYFGDDFDTDEAHSLKDQYAVDIERRQEKLVLLQKAQQFELYIESALQALDCSWDDVLRHMISDVVGGKESQRAARNTKQRFENFSPTSSRSLAILERLWPSTPERMTRTATLCETFEKMAKFDLWHIARRSKPAQVPEEDAPDHFAALGDLDRAFTCRLCLRFACPYHGEERERLGSDSDEDSVESVLATDIVNPPTFNHRKRVALHPLPLPIGLGSTNSRRRKDAIQLSNRPDECNPFYPCYHPGKSCENAACRCFNESRPCEKTCACEADCARRFQGCSCTKKRCFRDADCACWNNGRECDPDLCGMCGVCEVIDPINRHDEVEGKCRNGSIQRGVPKHTVIGDSGIHGLGLYALEEIGEHEFVGEYKGEIITKEEAERRGAVYEHQRLSYLFSLNATQEVDSTNYGNKVRFINHATGDKANLYPRIIMVNTVHRIALYANCKIKRGQELLFDYGPMFPDEQLGGINEPKSKKSAPHVRNANLVKGFVDFEESEDELGNVKAKAVDQPALGKATIKTKKHRSTADRPDARHDNYGSAEARLAAFNISHEPGQDQTFPDVDDADYMEDDDADFKSGSGEGEESDEFGSEGDIDDLDEFRTGPKKRGRPKKHRR